MLKRFLAVVLCAAIPLPALAQTHVIAELGTAPLIGQVASTSQLQDDVREQRALFAAAGSGLGLTPREFAVFQERISSGQVAYVTIPRRLDAMSWRTGSRVHVLRDVVIPANTKGWEIDIDEPGEVVALFVPNKCGNLSLVRRRVPLVAAVTPVDKPLPPAIADATQAAPPPAPVPVATPLPYADLGIVQAPSPPRHHASAWPLLLLLPLAAMLASHGHSAPAAFSPIAPAAPAPAPSPVAGCPTPAPH